MKKILCFFLIPAILLCAGCSRKSNMPYDFPAPKGKELAAMAGGIPIYTEEIEDAFNAQLQAYELNRQHLLSSDLPEEEKQYLLDQLTPPSRREILQKKILRILQLREAEKHNIPDFKKEAEAQHRAVMEAWAQAEDSPETALAQKVYSSAVERSGLSAAQYEQRISIPAYQQAMILSALQKAFEQELDKSIFYGAATYEEYTELLAAQYEVEIFVPYPE